MIYSWHRNPIMTQRQNKCLSQGHCLTTPDKLLSLSFTGGICSARPVLARNRHHKGRYLGPGQKSYAIYHQCASYHNNQIYQAPSFIRCEMHSWAPWWLKCSINNSPRIRYLNPFMAMAACYSSAIPARHFTERIRLNRCVDFLRFRNYMELSRLAFAYLPDRVLPMEQKLVKSGESGIWGPVSISEKTSFRKISLSLEATRLVL